MKRIKRVMKFVRFGDMKAFEQKLHRACPNIDQSPHRPPRRKGFFAFPYAFFDRFYIICRPASEIHSQMSYLRDGHGRKMTDTALWELSKTEYERNTINGRMEPKAIQKMTDNELLRSLNLPKQPIVREKKPSWVCVMADPTHPPRIAIDGGLNQKFEYLTDAEGNRIDAREFFDREWHPSDFSNPDGFEFCTPKDISNEVFWFFDLYKQYDRYNDRHGDGGVKLTLDYLRKRGIHSENLFAWPVYPPFEDVLLTVFKKPHVFEYGGCVWHHLRKFVPAGSILAAYGTTWVYTSVQDFGRALRHVEPRAYAKQKALQGNARAKIFGGPRCDSATFDIDGMYEVFFDEDDIRKIS